MHIRLKRKINILVGWETKAEIQKSYFLMNVLVTVNAREIIIACSKIYHSINMDSKEYLKI